MIQVSCSRFSLLAALAVFASLTAMTSSSRAGPITGTLYYTTFGNQSLNKVDFNYNGTNAFSLSANTRITYLPGADGLVFTSNGNVAVGGQGNAIYVVNPTTGHYNTVSAGGTSAYHMMADNNGNIYSSGIPGTPAVYNGTVSTNGTALTFKGGADQYVDTITYVGSQGFYTSSSANGYGNFGKINIDLTNDTYTTQRIFTGMDGFHGMTYDPFTGDLITFGDNYILQLDPLTDTIVSSVNPGVGGTFDQGTVDGQGHLLIANNDGYLFFMDYSQSGLVGASGNFRSSQFLNNYLDDVAPLIGPGGSSGASAAPEPSSVVLLVLGGLGLAGYGCRSRRKSLMAAA